MQSFSYSKAREALADCLRTAADDFEPVIIRRRNRPDAVLVNYDEWRAMAETLHVLGSPRNARRIRESLSALEQNKGLITKTPEELGL